MMADEFPCIVIDNIDDSKFLIGDTTGLARECQLLTDECRIEGDRAYQGLTGSVMGFAVHPTLPLMAIIGCDRTIHVFDRSKDIRTAMKVATTKTLPTCVYLFADEIPEEKSDDKDWELLQENDSNIWDNFTAEKISEKKQESVI